MAFPTLTSNAVLKSLYNMAVVQTAFTPELDVDDFVRKFRVDGNMYGDTKAYISADVLKSVAWTQDSTDACNVLATHRPLLDEQVIVMDKFRQIALTLDEITSKLAFTDEGSFAQVNAVLLSMLQGTKQVYDYSTLATFIGLEKSTVGKQSQTVAAGATAQTIAQKVADVLVDMKRPNRDYNDWQNMRAYGSDKLMVVWNSDYVNKIKKLDLPTIFNADMVDIVKGDVLPACYFGTINTTQKTGDAAGTIRFLEETTVGTGVNAKEYFPGDAVPNGTSVAANKSYTVDPKVICKIIGKGGVPYMSGFEVSTSFHNARNLSTNYYLTFGHNSLAHLKDKAFVTISEEA